MHATFFLLSIVIPDQFYHHTMPCRHSNSQQHEVQHNTTYILGGHTLFDRFFKSQVWDTCDQNRMAKHVPLTILCSQKCCNIHVGLKCCAHLTLLLYWLCLSKVWTKTCSQFISAIITLVILANYVPIRWHSSAYLIISQLHAPVSHKFIVKGQAAKDLFGSGRARKVSSGIRASPLKKRTASTSNSTKRSGINSSYFYHTEKNAL